MLYAFNPVGFGSMLIAAGLSVIAFFGGLGESIRPYSPLVASTSNAMSAITITNGRT